MPRSRLSPAGCPLANKFRSFACRSRATAGRKQLVLSALVGGFLLAAGAPSAFAGDDHNPIGVSGVFEGMITTGCAYNVVSHNARREIEDIVVPGAIGKYGLKMTRYYNSRRTNYGGMMGPGWTHQYMWIRGNDKIEHPNGDAWDSHCTGDWGLPGPLGVSEWPMTTQDGDPAFRLADGGTVVFENPSWGVATKIIDPYGQETTITIDAGSGRITQVTEPGGRYLKFIYNVPNYPTLLGRVEAHGLGNNTVTDWVNYRYTSKPTGGNIVTSAMCLTQVDYSDGTTHAKYTWQVDNQPENPTPPCPCPLRLTPLVIGCDDVRYQGPMRRIAYQYPAEAAHGAHGDLIRERYWDGIEGNEDSGAIVSKIDPRAPPPLDQQANFETTFTETRGDGPTRTSRTRHCTSVGAPPRRAARYGVQTLTARPHSSSLKATQTFGAARRNWVMMGIGM